MPSFLKTTPKPKPMRYSSFQRTWSKPERSPLVLPAVPAPVRVIERVRVDAAPVVVEKEVLLRSKPYRLYVSGFACFGCGIEGMSQCAHENFGKALQGKVCDSRSFPLCVTKFKVGCHEQFDLALDDGTREERRERGAAYTARMQATAVSDGWDLKTLKRKV